LGKDSQRVVAERQFTPALFTLNELSFGQSDFGI
jgi:hypothetical protein